ncbi:GtrA family protein [Tropicimonas sp. IMCC6043]|uniref:GtrA family protein n=1 Tax=Tropicimonas sp. IMCC6043 TaxID=2510645 RepID=UPI00101DBEDC|nr:GtrA family protein [Tropicimonas sp. IMCC6043]RYH06631.1 GtrA family protein [Tropicimonas sp. IMCC6043]
MRALFSQFLRYSWVGLLNTALGLFVIWGLMLAGLGPYAANVAGYAAGLVLSFFLNRTWTFRAQEAGWPVARFLCAFAIAYGANLTILTLGLEILPGAAYALQPVAIGIYSVVFFLLCRFFVFSVRNTET